MFEALFTEKLNITDSAKYFDVRSSRSLTPITTKFSYKSSYLFSGHLNKYDHVTKVKWLKTDQVEVARIRVGSGPWGGMTEDFFTCN